MLTINGQKIKFKTVETELLNKTRFSESGIHNVMKTMASEFINSEKDDYVVHIRANGDVFHLVRKLTPEEITVELKDIYASDLYVNSGIITENITKKDATKLI